MTLTPPPHLSSGELEMARQTAIEIFRQERMQEPLEAYLDAFDAYRGKMEELLEVTVDLSRLGDQAVEILADPALLEAVRYLAGPPLSQDDLKVLAEASLAPTRLREDAEMARR
ncbi:MAG: XamI family restriction endonuclease, partial [Thermoleophilaceae bacterium]